MWKILACAVFCYSLMGISWSLEDVSKKEGGCGSNLTHPIGGITLNNHTLPDQSCVWYIYPNSTTPPKIMLFIRSVFLHENDEISIYSNEADAKNNTNPILDPVRAQNGSFSIFTPYPVLIIKLTGTDTTFFRTFEAEYATNDCHFNLHQDIEILHSPKHADNSSESFTCTYSYDGERKPRQFLAFTVEEYNFTSSSLELKETTSDNVYTTIPPIDFFPKSKQMKIIVNMHNSKEYFRLRTHLVDTACSKYINLASKQSETWLESPPEELNNGSIISECRWIIENTDAKEIFGFTLGDVHFDDVLDIVAVNDGGSELSVPLLQVTSSNVNSTKSQLIRNTGKFMWVGFKARTYASKFSANITVHGQGGYFKENTSAGNVIKMEATDGNDTVFLLEVAGDKVVLLNFSESAFPLPATLSVYDGFDTTNLLATLHGNVWYPVISKSSKMMLIATNFKNGNFVANFKGVSNGCLHMSTFTNENYILSGNCNSTCLWVIPPQDHPGSVLLLNLQFLSLAKDDQLSILQLDSLKTRIGDVFANTTHVPQITLPAEVGALVEVTRAPCAKGNEDVVVVGHSSYIPTCGSDMMLNAMDSFRLTSPMHPDTYPVFSRCTWKLSTAKENLIHLAFNTMNLAPNHCLTITHLTDNKTVKYEGNKLEEDVFLFGNSTVLFDAVNCSSSKVAEPLVSSEGFVLNGTVTNCGDVFIGKASGEFSVLPNKTLCVWKVSIPEAGENANDINIISYTMTEKDKNGNYELSVYDGNSVREKVINNNTGSGIWSRTNNLIFLYRRINLTLPSALIDIKYNTISCNSSMQCDNKLCLHPDWRCNGINECGDYSDERNCASVPLPPVKEYVGYSASTFWVTIIAMLFLGALFGVGVPYLYERYKYGYRRFDDVSVIG